MRNTDEKIQLASRAIYDALTSEYIPYAYQGLTEMFCNNAARAALDAAMPETTVEDLLGDTLIVLGVSRVDDGRWVAEVALRTDPDNLSRWHRPSMGSGPTIDAAIRAAVAARGGE